MSESGPANPDGQKHEPKLLDQLREALRVRHYSRRTEATYRQWVKRFIFFITFAIRRKWPSPRSMPFSLIWR